MATIQMFPPSEVYVSYPFSETEEQIRERVRKLDLELEEPHFEGTYDRSGKAMGEEGVNFGYDVATQDYQHYNHVWPRYGRWTWVKGERKLETALKQLAKDENVFQMLQFAFTCPRKGYGEPPGRHYSLDMGLSPYKSCTFCVKPGDDVWMRLYVGRSIGWRIQEVLLENFKDRWHPIQTDFEREDQIYCRFEARLEDLCESVVVGIQE